MRAIGTFRGKAVSLPHIIGILFFAQKGFKNVVLTSPLGYTSAADQ